MVRQDKIAYLVTAFQLEAQDFPSSSEPPLDCMIRTVLSQATSDRNRDNSYRSLRKIFPKWKDVAGADTGQIETAIAAGGLARRKSATIKNVLVWTENRFGDYSLRELTDWETEDILETLIKIPGIGIKTASIVACFSLNRNVFPVDVHVHRILSRMGITSRKLNPDQTFYQVDPFIPVGRDRELHISLIAHGRSICRPGNPDCSGCLIAEHCDYANHKNDWIEC